VNRDEYEKWLDLPRGTIKLLYNGFLPGSIRIRRRDEVGEARRLLGLPAGVKLVGTVMRLAPEKDPDLWLRTALAITQARADTCFLLAGYGELADHVVGKIHELGLAERFKLTGATIDVGLIYAAMDVFLMTSQFEGTPNALIEAQAAGVPIVTPLVGGTGEAVLHGTTGLLLNSRTEENLARAVVQILDDSSFRERTACHGPAFVSKRFGHRRMINETLALYGHSRFSIRERALEAFNRLQTAVVRRS
jgi:glycosyltransferase involved in cell wall biosynthesis